MATFWDGVATTKGLEGESFVGVGLAGSLVEELLETAAVFPFGVMAEGERTADRKSVSVRAKIICLFIMLNQNQNNYIFQRV